MRYCLLILSAILVVSSCTKVEQTPTRGDVMRDGKWQVESGTYKYRVFRNGAYKDSIETYKITDCFDDDFIVFGEGNKGEHVTGEKFCNINETANMDFTWGLTNGGNGINIYDAPEIFGNDVNNGDIIEFFDDKFGIKFLTVTPYLIIEEDKSSYYMNDTLTTTIYFKKSAPAGQ